MELEEYEELTDEIFKVSDTVGLPPFFWDDVCLLSTHFDLSFWAYYYIDANNELIEAKISPKAFDYAASFFADKNFQRCDWPNPDQTSIDKYTDVLFSDAEVCVDEKFGSSEEENIPFEVILDEVKLIQTGARIGARHCAPFSRHWYVCQASEQLMKCLSQEERRRSRAILHFSMMICASRSE